MEKSHKETGENQDKNKIAGKEMHLPQHKGSQFLIDKYNINDQAYSDSSLDDFVKTASGFRHADDIVPDTNFGENPGGPSPAD